MKTVTGYETIGEQGKIARSEGWEILLNGIVEGRKFAMKRKRRAVALAVPLKRHVKN
jgi:hypothetical protein